MTNQAAEEKVCVFSFDLKVKTKERKFQITDRCIGQHCCRHREDKILRNTGRYPGIRLARVWNPFGQCCAEQK